MGTIFLFVSSGMVWVLTVACENGGVKICDREIGMRGYFRFCSEHGHTFLCKAKSKHREQSNCGYSIDSADLGKHIKNWF